jgi:hypothetical protein
MTGYQKIKMKKREYELSRVEILMKLMQNKKVDFKEVFKV